MKHFKCIALDKNWRQCMGTFSASSEEEAKQRLFARGFSIIQLKEISEAETSHHTDFFHSPCYPDKEREKRREVAASGRPRALKTHEELSPEQKRGIFILAGLVTLIAGIGIAAFILLHPSHKKQLLDPHGVVRSYLTLGFRSDWTAQYALLSTARAEPYMTAENYALQMEKNWLDLPVLQSSAWREGAGKPEVPPVEITLLNSFGVHAQVAANMIVSNEKRRFVFLLFFDAKDWKIDYIRDLGKAEADIRFLAMNPQGPRRSNVLNELQLDFGYTAEEIADLVKQAHLQNVVTDLHASIEANREQEEKAPQETKKNYVDPYTREADAEVSNGADEVQTQLDALMNMVDGLKEEPRRARR